MFRQSVLAASLALCLFNSPNALANLDQKSFKLLDKAETLLNEAASLPDSKWIGRDKQSAYNEIDSLIEEMLDKLGSEKIKQQRKTYRKVEQAILDEQQEISRLKEKQYFAISEEASTLTKYTPTATLKSWTAQTKGDYQLLIDASAQNIKELEASLVQLRTEMSQELAVMGIDLAPDKLDFLLNTVTGDDIVSMMLTFESIKQVTEQLATLVQANSENLDAVKRYYGMIVVLHRLVVNMQQSFIGKIETSYIPKLKIYQKEAVENIKQAKKLLSLTPKENRDVLVKNIESNQLTAQVTAVYVEYLQDQLQQVKKALTQAKQKEAVAENTYATVRLSLQVLSLIRESQRDFEALAKLQMPEIMPFDNPKIKEEFFNITNKLR
ncbi:hypothetical protein VQ643_14730 [Pseudomonas sp. F1_0610]|uniref:hypothetical protein n=1 Tax=Pseudomonas sp. F1_0610 TaxID=3114284 RepID=UPI0039C0CEBA